LDRTRTFLLVMLLVVIAVGSFYFLNMGEDLSLGWTVPARIQEKSAFSPHFSYHQGELWLAFKIVEKDARVIKITHSPDGVEWSSPFILVKEAPGDCGFPYSISLLERPDGTLWFLWTAGKRDEYCPDVLYYSALEHDGTWSAPQEIHRLDREHHIRDTTNSPDGGLVILGERSRRGYAIIEGGKRVPAGAGFECFVQSSNKNFEWGSLFFLTSTTFPDAVDTILDSNGIIWVVYSEGNEIEGIFFRTSKDGISWSSPERISVNNFSSGDFLQKSDGQYAFFLYSYPGSIYVSYSSDGLKWSQPGLVSRMDRIYSFDVAESDDGTLWIVFEGKEGIYLTHYSHEKYLEDTHVLKSFHTKNAILSLSFTFLVGISWVLLNKALTTIGLHKSD
jgi:hypothetical protein